MIDLSSYAKELNGKPVCVFGLGLSGLATVRALVAAGIKTTAFDDNADNCAKAKNFGADIQDLTKIDLSGYANLILAPGVPYSFNPHAVVVNAEKYGVEIIGDLELLHRAQHGVKTIGITGTNGKSTTTALLTHVLNECGLKAMMGGNIGKAVFDIEDIKNLDVLVLEISSYQMDLCPTYHPDISLILNITPDHLDRHGSMGAYVSAKARILDGAGIGIIGVDDDYTQKIFDTAFCSGTRFLTPVSVKSEIPEGYFVQNKTLFHNTHGENIEIGSFEDLETLKGLHNFQNAACVYVAAKNMGLTDKDIFKAFKTYAGLPHRQYLVTKYKNITYINDSKATNAEAAAKALASYQNIFWIIGGRPKQGGLEGLEIFKDKIIKTYVIGEAAEEFAKWLSAHGFDYEVNHTLDKATTAAHKDALNYDGDAVVMLSPACASWDQFKSFEGRGDAFADIVKELAGG